MKIQHTLIALAAATFAFGAQAIEFRSADVHNSDDYPTVAAVKHMSELLDKRSNGKYKIKVYNKSALGSEKETLDQVKIGALEMNRVNISSLNSMCPKSLVPTMPFLFNSIAHMRKSLDGPAGEEILKGCEHEGLVGLAFYDSGARSIYAKKPVHSVADVKGMKIRVQQSDLWVSLVSAMGANERMVVRVVETDPPRRLVEERVDGTRRGTTVFEVEPDGAGSRVTLTSDIDLPRLLSAVAKGPVERGLSQQLENLDRLSSAG